MVLVVCNAVQPVGRWGNFRPFHREIIIYGYAPPSSVCCVCIYSYDWPPAMPLLLPPPPLVFHFLRLMFPRIKQQQQSVFDPLHIVFFSHFITFSIFSSAGAGVHHWEFKKKKKKKKKESSFIFFLKREEILVVVFVISHTIATPRVI